MLLNYVIWDISPILLPVGAFEVRWYGVLFATGFLLGRQLWHYFLKAEKKPIEDLDALVLHIMLGTVIGARLGHVLFYDFSYYSQHPLEIFLPFVFTPTFKFTGYSGLASHGAAIGILTAIYIYVNYVITLSLFPPKLTVKKQRRAGQSYLWIADRMMIVVALAGCLIRIGNFMNSEIIGKPTNNRQGVLFARNFAYRIQRSSKAIDKVQVTKSNTKAPHDAQYQPIIITVSFRHAGFEEKATRYFLEHDIKHLLTEDPSVAEHICEARNLPLQYTLSKSRKGTSIAHIATLGIPRHPAQLYEALSCFVLFLLLFYQWKVKQGRLRPGTVFGLFLIIVFGLRTVYEFFKESNIVCETVLGPLRTPQILSLPLVIAGIILLLYSTDKEGRTG
ncbi:MAG: prolipoprotein diacylglyceryl transferase [Amoebophilaceae bacterium]|jgi:prolipoprotein diacylglyceryl transferase|nr:prolipoprotein diacylglyceryl transferase [Amoebophilaceae bacterium]